MGQTTCISGEVVEEGQRLGSNRQDGRTGPDGVGSRTMMTKDLGRKKKEALDGKKAATTRQGPNDRGVSGGQTPGFRADNGVWSTALPPCRGATRVKIQGQGNPRADGSPGQIHKSGMVAEGFGTRHRNKMQVWHRRTVERKTNVRTYHNEEHKCTVAED